VLYKLKKTLNIKKLGHSGTLDPDAEGVLPVFTGKATKLILYQEDFSKVYRGEMFLGKRTDTQDSKGNVLEEKEVPLLDESKINDIFNEFTGSIEQIPPMYSAVKYKGRKLYEYARKGVEIDRKPRKVNISNLFLIDYRDNLINFEVECSSGTYIRTLCDDIGQKIGCGAYLNSLIRIRSGAFHVSDSHKLQDITRENLKDILLPPGFALKHMSSVVITEEQEIPVLAGNRILLNEAIPEAFCVYNKNNILLAIAETFTEEDKFYLQPLKVLL
jgi:tRNA pseudouridine55 synthase